MQTVRKLFLWREVLILMDAIVCLVNNKRWKSLSHTLKEQCLSLPSQECATIVWHFVSCHIQIQQSCITFTSSLWRVTYVSDFLLHLKSELAAFSAECWVANKHLYFPYCSGRCIPQERKPNPGNHRKCQGNVPWVPACPNSTSEAKKKKPSCLHSLWCRNCVPVSYWASHWADAGGGCWKRWKCQKKKNMIQAAPGGNKPL